MRLFTYRAVLEVPQQGFAFPLFVKGLVQAASYAGYLPPQREVKEIGQIEEQANHIKVHADVNSFKGMPPH